MKTAISIPDSIFEDAEKLAKDMQVSRSKLYTEAIIYYVQFHQNGGVTAALNKVYDKERSTLDKGLSKMQRRSIEKW